MGGIRPQKVVWYELSGARADRGGVFMTYDAATRTITTKTPLGRVTTARLDTRGRLSLSSVPGLADTTYGYDERGRLRSVAMGSRSVSYEYNDANELVSVTDALQRTTSFTYDAAGRPAHVSLPGNRGLGYSYDAHGNLASIAPPGRGTHSFEYTPVDLPELYEPPPGGDPPLSYAYNRDRQLRAFTRADGTSFELVYDEAGRLTRFASRDEVYTYGYDAASGQLVTVGDAAGNQLSYTYDGTLVTAVSWAGRVSGSVTLVYDNNLRVQRENGVTYTYDSDGLVTNAGALRLTRSATNGLLSGTVLGTVTDTYTYNAFGEVQRYVAKAGAATIMEVDYVRDAAGRIEKRTEKVFGNTIVTAYTYDTAGRLGEVTIGTAATTYRYDTNGNRLLKAGAAGQIAGVYDEHDRLTSYGGVTFTYTPNGELATRAGATGTTRYTYDSLGNLTGVVLPGGRTIEYIVDPQGRRIGRKVDGALVRGWLYADQQRIVAELDGNGAVISQFVYGSRTNAPDYMVRSGVTYRFLHDHLGSVRIVLNTGTGAVAQMLGYDEFGNVLSDTAPGFQPFGFAGGLYDGDTKLVRFGARDYDPYAGRWTSKDPIGFAGGDTNLYAYVSSDPINLIDPSGLITPYAAPPLLGIPPQGVQDFMSGAGSYVRGLYRFGRHLARRTGLMGNCEQDRVAVEDRLLQTTFNTLNTPAGRRQVFNEATSYIANNPERVAGRALTGIAVGTVAATALSAKLGPGARLIGPALGAAAAYGDIRYALEQGRARLEDLIEAGVGGQAGNVGPSSCGCN